MWSTTTSDMLTWEGGNPGAKVKINWDGASPEYLSTMGLQLVAGRNFHPDILSDSGNVIINQRFATLMGKAGRVGALITYGDTTKKYFHVIGIVKDYLFNDLAGTVITPLMLSCDPEVNGNYSFLTIRLKPGKDLSAQLAKMEAVMKADNPGYPADFYFVDEQFNDWFEWQAHIGTMAAVFAVLAVLISCLGLFGLAGVAAVVITLLTVSFQAIRAALSNPVKTLRTE